MLQRLCALHGWSSVGRLVATIAVAGVSASWAAPGAKPGAAPASAAERSVAAAASASAASSAPVGVPDFAASAPIAFDSAASGPALSSDPALGLALPLAAGRSGVVLQADTLHGRPGLDTTAEGHADLTYEGTRIQADLLSYDGPDDRASARGQVRVFRAGNVFSGPELLLQVQRFEGYFLQPDYYFGQFKAGGHAERIDFIGEQRVVATGATYTSCLIDGSGMPDWLLTARQVKMDFSSNEGVADGAVVRFLGVPILAVPTLSFSLNETRKSGWLPPVAGLDSKSGFQLAVPYYWNIAPNRDATITPTLSTRRGAGANAEFRYLEPTYAGHVNLSFLPHDDVADRSRFAIDLAHDADLPGDTLLHLRTLRVSDDAYWKDYPRSVQSLTPRLLLSDLQVSRPLADWATYARVQSWQALQGTDSRFEVPYERAPQIGARYSGRLGGLFGSQSREDADDVQAGSVLNQVRTSFEVEFNRFDNPNSVIDRTRPTGVRLHALGGVSLPYVTPGWRLTPTVSFNAATYALDRPVTTMAGAGSRDVSRAIPTFSLDSAWSLERHAAWFGRSVLQTLEPRLLYVDTPYHDQSLLPNFDAYPKDFNFESVYARNEFSGVDRVSDEHKVTAGVTTRLIDPDTGAEALRLGIAQRYLLQEQRLTVTGVPITQRFSDVLLLGSTSLVPSWTFDSIVQYSPETHRTARSIVSARYSPGPYRTINATYRLSRGLTEQVEVGWQWPLLGPVPGDVAPNGGGGVPPSAAASPEATLAEALNAPAGNGRSGNGHRCGGTWYTVGRVNYSMIESRFNDALVGFEYDAGCWIGRVVAERLSTGRSESTSRLLFQLELIGLSRIGSNPLQVLKDNIIGYRLLRESPTALPSP